MRVGRLSVLAVAFIATPSQPIRPGSGLVSYAWRGSAPPWPRHNSIFVLAGNDAQRRCRRIDRRAATVVIWKQLSRYLRYHEILPLVLSAVVVVVSRIGAGPASASSMTSTHR
ncbi:MAG: hypothetical protein H6905_08770 [Hyphomicrobiales bacterium]|nr:hypothetical protein [Hyphomicrobiales bacterium]